MKNWTWQAKLAAIGTVLLLVAFVMFLTGCQEEQKVWGQGDPPADYQSMFGNDNAARLDYVHTGYINELILKVQRLTEQIASLEKLNSKQHRTMGETDIRAFKRLDRLDGQVKELYGEPPTWGGEPFPTPRPETGVFTYNSDVLAKPEE